MTKQECIYEIKGYLDKKKIDYVENHYLKMGLKPCRFYLEELNTCIDLQDEYTESKLFYCSDNIINYIKIDELKGINKQLGFINTYR